MPKGANSLGQVNEIEPSKAQALITSLRQLYEMGKPKTDFEVKERISMYFEFCEKSALRPGIESISLALGVSRTTFFNWCKGIKCSPERQEKCEAARGLIIAFLEQTATNGLLNPAISIFMLKNWASYRDTLSFETDAKTEPSLEAPVSREQIAAEFGQINNEGLLPELPTIESED